MKIALIQINIADFDAVKPIPDQSVHYDYFLYTEKNLPFPLSSLSNRGKVTYLKLQHYRFLPGYDIFIYIDGRAEVISPDFVKDIAHKSGDIVITKHPQRETIKEEYDFIFQYMAQPESKAGQYLNSRYDYEALKQEANILSGNQPLYACGVFSWKVTDYMKLFFNKWWQMTVQYSGFDQCVFARVSWEMGVKITPYTYDLIKINKHK